MALDKLTLYNNALLLLGQRKLSAVDEDRSPRYYLDDTYDMGAVDYCLQLVQPLTASKTVALSSPATSSEHGLDSVHTLPSDFIKVVGVFTDDKLDQPTDRYIVDGNTIACEHATIYLRYTSNSFALTTYSPVFGRVISAFLAQELAEKIVPEDYDRIAKRFLERVKAAKALEGEQEPKPRASAPTVTLTNSWRHVYNDALLVMGLDEINDNNDDSNRRAKLDRTLDAGLVENLLQETGWTFGMKSEKVDYNPSYDPDWGYPYVFDHPSDMERLDGMFADEYMQVPLRQYADEGSKWYAGQATVYVQYVSSDYLTTIDSWPAYFRRLVAARMAKEAAPSLKKEGADVDNARDEYARRLHDGQSNDAAVAPPRIISDGSWVRSRFQGYNGRGRP